MNAKLRSSITVGPFSIMFCNVNKEMGLAGHCHFAEVYCEFDTLASTGFPSFEETHNVVQEVLKDVTDRKSFKDHTNEKVALALFEIVDSMESPEFDKYGGQWKLRALTLRVRGVPDHIGHANGFTEYKVERL